jgi:hypothetical protein
VLQRRQGMQTMQQWICRCPAPLQWVHGSTT